MAEDNQPARRRLRRSFEDYEKKQIAADVLFQYSRLVLVCVGLNVKPMDARLHLMKEISGMPTSLKRKEVPRPIIGRVRDDERAPAAKEGEYFGWGGKGRRGSNRIDEKKQAAADVLFHYSKFALVCLGNQVRPCDLRLHLMKEISGAPTSLKKASSSSSSTAAATAAASSPDVMGESSSSRLDRHDSFRTL